MQNYSEKSKIPPLAVAFIATVCSTIVKFVLQIASFYVKQSQFTTS